MDELLELRAHIEHGRYPEALILIGELEEMSREDKINKISSFLEILLLHLIKQHAEKRTTRSGDVSIKNALTQIARTNRRHKASGTYLGLDELQLAMEDVYENALRFASLEAFGGVYEPEDLAKMIDEKAIKTEALRLVLDH
jgi:hypothetical protein